MDAEGSCVVSLAADLLCLFVLRDEHDPKLEATQKGNGMLNLFAILSIPGKNDKPSGSRQNERHK